MRKERDLEEMSTCMLYISICYGKMIYRVKDIHIKEIIEITEITRKNISNCVNKY